MISVVIPAYRSERFLPDIVGDVFRQNYTDWELIVVSNGAGQEAQLAVLERLKGEAPAGHRVEILSESIGNVSHARNVGMEAAKGEWLAFVDADDRLTPNYLQDLFDATKSGEPEMVISGHTDYWPNRQTPHGQVKPCEQETMLTKRQLVEMDRFFTANVWGKLISKALVADNQLSFNVNYTIGEDGVFVKQCLLIAQRVKAIPACNYGYRHTNTASAIFVYHEGGEAISLSNNLYGQLMRQAGCSKQSIEEMQSFGQYNVAVFAVSKLFLSGCPLSFAQKCREVRRIVFDNEDMPSLMASMGHRCTDNVHRLFDRLYALHSPTMMVLVFQVRQLLANTYHKFLTLHLPAWRRLANPFHKA